MFALAVALTIVLLLETLPSAVAGLIRARAGLTRGRSLGAYLLFASLALAVLITGALRA